MIGRVWHGWTSRPNAAEHAGLLRERIFPEIAARNVAGYRGIQLFRHEGASEVEFKTAMWFESLDALCEYAGEDCERAYVPPSARAVLARFDERSRHDDSRDARRYRSAAGARRAPTGSGRSAGAAVAGATIPGSGSGRRGP